MQIKKVCLIIPSMRHGGAERVISILANEWAKRSDIEVYLIILTKQRIYYNLDSKVKVIEPDRGYAQNSFGRFIYSFWSLFFIRRAVKKIQPVSVLSFCERYNNLVLLATKGFLFNIFVSDRNNPSKNLGFIHEKLRRWLYRRATGIIAQTETGKDILREKTGNRNIQVIPNPLRAIDKLQNIEKEKIILNVGRNVEQKNQLELINMFASLRDSDEWKLQVLGIGHLRDRMEQAVKRLGLEGRVELLDFQDNIDFYYQKASIFAFPSLYEGFPNALSEAMANGLPCLSFNCPTGPSELINDSYNGFLVELGDNQTFVEKLQMLTESEQLRESIGFAAKKSSDRFSVSKVSNQYLNTILEQ